MASTLLPSQARPPPADGRTGVDIVAPGGGITAAGSTATEFSGPRSTACDTGRDVDGHTLRRRSGHTGARAEPIARSPPGPSTPARRQRARSVWSFASMTNAVSFRASSPAAMLPNQFLVSEEPAAGVGLVRPGATLLERTGRLFSVRAVHAQPRRWNEVLIPAHTQLIGDVRAHGSANRYQGAVGDFALFNITLVDPATGAATLGGTIRN